MKVLFIASEVAPFSEETDIASLVRTLPERLTENPAYEARILMPRYGIVSERRNRLHEVIRLSGTEIPSGPNHDTLRVKVASIPGIRLQVYFMDSNRYFKRKGIHYNKKDGSVFDDNVERALYFARATLSTATRLGWQPDVIHAAGWISGLVPLLLRHEYAAHPMLGSPKVVYTPDATQVMVSAKCVETLALPEGERLTDQDVRDIGGIFADAVLFPPGHPVPEGSAGILLGGEPAEMGDRAIALYRELLEAPVAS